MRSQRRKPFPPFETTRVFSQLVNTGFSYPFPTFELGWHLASGTFVVYTFRANADATQASIQGNAVNKNAGYSYGDTLGGELFNWLFVPNTIDKRL